MDGNKKTQKEYVVQDAKTRHFTHVFLKFFNNLLAKKNIDFFVRLVEWRAIHLHSAIKMKFKDMAIAGNLFTITFAHFSYRFDK